MLDRLRIVLERAMPSANKAGIGIARIQGIANRTTLQMLREQPFGGAVLKQDRVLAIECHESPL